MSSLVREGRLVDIDTVVDVHLDAFPGYMLSLLGRRFLRTFYAYFVRDRDGRLLVAGPGAADAHGFLAGTSDPETFFARLRRRHALRLGVAAVPAFVQHPRRVGERLLAALTYSGDPPPGLPGHWLISSLGVRRGAAGQGAGTALVARFCEVARQGGAAGAYLVTDGSDNDAALRFYGRLGFVEHSAWLRRDGRRLLLLKRSFAS